MITLQQKKDRQVRQISILFFKLSEGIVATLYCNVENESFVILILNAQQYEHGVQLPITTVADQVSRFGSCCTIPYSQPLKLLSN